MPCIRKELFVKLSNNAVERMDSTKSWMFGSASLLNRRLTQCCAGAISDAITDAPACREGGPSLLPWNDRDSGYGLRMRDLAGGQGLK
eukprot:1139979-Pelagomonas_calceolata.AAC.2